jgi:pyruvate/2-oxoglutarate dehydrogenase complex dihydrolipoamide dehydrogenase (E3) component
MDWRAGQESKFRDRAERIRLYRGQARFTAPHSISVNGEDLESDRIFIDTGTRPIVPQIQGLEKTNYLTNASIMEVREIPEHLLILGAGYVGLEFGQMFRRFGSEVTVIDLGDHILPHEDTDISDALRQILEKEGMRFVLGARVKRVAQTGRQVILESESGGQEELGERFTSAGRRWAAAQH